MPRVWLIAWLFECSYAEEVIVNGSCKSIWRSCGGLLYWCDIGYAKKNPVERAIRWNMPECMN
jgi:hypothetical protein